MKKKERRQEETTLPCILVEDRKKALEGRKLSGVFRKKPQLNVAFDSLFWETSPAPALR